MSTNKLDQFFKNKLEKAQPSAFNPQHWEQAKSMLVKDKKDRFGVWFFAFIGLLVLSVVVFYMTSSDSQLPVDTSISADQKMATHQSPNLMSSDAASNSALNLEGENLSKGPENLTSAVKNSGTPKTRATARVMARQAPLASVEPAKTTEDPADHDAINPLPAEVTFGEKSHRSRSMDLVPSVAMHDFRIGYQHLASGLTKVPIMVRTKFKRSRMGWSGTLLLNPSDQHDSPMQGLVAGFLYEKYLRPHILLGVKPSIQLQTNQESFSKFEQVTSYGFSATNTTYGLQADNLQFLSAPIYLGVEFRRHTVELGVSIDLLLAARGKLQELAIEDQVISRLRDLGSGWIDTDQMRQLNTNLFIGYKNTINQRLKTGLTFYYNPAKLYPGLPNNLPQINQARWYFGMQAHYYMK